MLALGAERFCVLWRRGERHIKTPLENREKASKMLSRRAATVRSLHRLIRVALEKYPLKKKSSFARFAGRWTAEEAVAFNDLTQRTVDEEDWK